MSTEALLDQAAVVLRARHASYGDASKAMATIAARWSITLGHAVTPAQVVLCMIDLKLARLGRNPKHEDSIIDLIGYSTMLHEVSR